MKKSFLDGVRTAIESTFIFTKKVAKRLRIAKVIFENDLKFALPPRKIASPFQKCLDQPSFGDQSRHSQAHFAPLTSTNELKTSEKLNSASWARGRHFPYTHQV